MPPSNAEMRREYELRRDKGQRFEAYMREGVLAAIEEDIIRPIFNEAYLEYLSADPADQGATARAQAKGQIIQRFKKRFEAIIQEGKEAVYALAEMDEMEL